MRSQPFEPTSAHRPSARRSRSGNPQDSQNSGIHWRIAYTRPHQDHATVSKWPCDLVGFDLSQSSGTKILFDLLAKSLQIVFLDRTAWHALRTPEITLFLSNCSTLPERFTTNNIVVSSVVKRLEHFGHSRLRRMEWPSSLMRVSTTLVSGF